MDLKLHDKVALVTGSSRGIGKAIVTALAQEGAAVLVHGRDLQRASAVADEIAGTGGRAHAIAADIEDDAQVLTAIQTVADKVGRIDILVNNAGGSSSRTEPWPGVSSDTWQSTFNRNVLAALRFTAQVLPAMMEADWGRIVNISSDAAIMPPASGADYAGSKAALAAITSSMSKAVAGKGITVNTISPGTIHSDKLDAKFRELGARLNKTAADAPWREIERAVLPLVGQIPVGRVGTVEELADVAAFLCSPLASYVTGANIRVDGGLFPGI